MRQLRKRKNFASQKTIINYSTIIAANINQSNYHLFHCQGQADLIASLYSNYWRCQVNFASLANSNNIGAEHASKQCIQWKPETFFKFYKCWKTAQIKFSMQIKWRFFNESIGYYQLLSSSKNLHDPWNFSDAKSPNLNAWITDNKTSKKVYT